MFDLESLKDNNTIFWVFHWPSLREAASECGWALAIHGSVVHDLDLMAMPWREDHATADNLASVLSSIINSNVEESRRSIFKYVDEKPNGRVVYTIIGGGTYIDLNVIDSTWPHIKAEQIVEAAKNHENQKGFGRLVHSPVSRGVSSAYGIGFLEGAEWVIDSIEQIVNLGRSNDLIQSKTVMNKNLTFGQAIEALKQGKKVAREGWNGKGMFLWLKPATTIKSEWCKDPILKSIVDANGGETEALGTICMKTADGKVLTGWLASQTDMLLEDWTVVE
jgi:hypothetical protein